ncbi:MAG: cytochrome c-type biogenesis protein [Burkholderiaceae bacterium]
MKRLVASLAMAAAFAGGAAFANVAVPTENDPVASKREHDLASKLRCLVCQNQSIAESNAALAQDLRRQVREQIAAGRSDAEIIDFMTSRYGDFVLYRPPFKATTALLWGGPAALAAIGVFVLVRVVRARRGSAAELPLTPEEHARAERLLGAAGEGAGNGQRNG